MRTITMILSVTLVAGACGTDSTLEGETTTTRAETVATTAAPTTSAVETTVVTTSATSTTATALPYDVLSVSGINLTYECQGSGSPTVVVLHGLAGPQNAAYDPEYAVYRPMLDAIAETTTVCFYGRPGVFGSDGPGGAQNLVDQSDMLAALVGGIGIDGPVIYAGHSWGGVLGMTMALRFPEDTAGLLLLDSGHPTQYEAFDEEPLEPFPPELIDGELPAELAFDTLGDLPITVLSAVMETDFPEDTEIWAELQDQLAALSTDSVHDTIDGADHVSLVFETAIITTAIEDLIARHRS